VAFVAAFVLVYGAGLLTVDRPTDGPTIMVAIGLGLAGVLVGTAIGWRQFGAVETPAASTRAPSVRNSRPAAIGWALVVVGLSGLVLYLVRIGGLPLFMAAAEQARLDAAEVGGAPLRVISLLAIPGSWLVLSDAARRGLRPLVAGWVVVVLVAGMWLLTANRAPSFLAVEVAIVITLLASGRTRLSRRSVTALVGLAMAIVLAAGIVGGVRRTAGPALGPPFPPATTVPARPPNYAALVRIALFSYLRVPVQNLQYTLDAVPDIIGWRLGWTYVQPLATVLPGKQTTFDADLKAALGQTYVGGGTVPGMLGESYANFGPPGWFIVPAVVAVFLAWLFALARRRNSPAAWALYAWAIVHAASSTIGGLIVASVFPYLAYGLLAAALLLSRGAAAARSG
jgi:hypothetical protein